MKTKKISKKGAWGELKPMADWGGGLARQYRGEPGGPAHCAGSRTFRAVGRPSVELFSFFYDFYTLQELYKNHIIQTRPKTSKVEPLIAQMSILYAPRMPADPFARSVFARSLYARSVPCQRHANAHTLGRTQGVGPKTLRKGGGPGTQRRLRRPWGPWGPLG